MISRKRYSYRGQLRSVSTTERLFRSQIQNNRVLLAGARAISIRRKKAIG